MQEAATSILISRNQQADGLNRMVVWSLAVHSVLLLGIVLMPRDWLRITKEQEAAPMMISLGPAGQADTGGMTAISEPSAEMIDRLILPMSNVCVACLREGIVDNADVVDGAVIFGTGYAPFRGGPLNYARTRGVDNVVSTLDALTDKFGGRFAPDAGWENFK